MSYGTPTTGQTGPAGLAGQTGRTGRTGTGDRPRQAQRAKPDATAGQTSSAGTAGRDATDPSGRPYPILHMELGHAPHTGLVPIPSLLTDRIDIGFRAEVSGTDTEKQP